MSVATAVQYTVDQCTWFVAKTVDWVPGGLGNARDWVNRAPSKGLAVSREPQIGWVAAWDAGKGGATGNGHVAIVTGFDPKTQLPIVSEMNWKGPGISDTRTLTASQAASVEGYIGPPGATGGTPLAPAQDVVAAYSGTNCAGWSQIASTGSGPAGFTSALGAYFGQSCVWHKILYTGVGVGLVLIGIKLIARPEPIRISIPNPAPAARRAWDATSVTK